jgi:hypothetical protein
MHALACIKNMNRKCDVNRGARGLEPVKGLTMRPLKDIVAANRKAVELGIKTGAFKPVGTEPAAPTLTPEEMKKLGLDQY